MAAEALKITAKDLIELGLADGVVSEPLGGAHQDPVATAATLKQLLVAALEELLKVPTAERLKQRYAKFRAHGHFFEKSEKAATA